MENNKPLILSWLSSLVDYEFEHDFRDQWILVNIWEDQLSITLDQRSDAQKELFNLLPDNIKGVKQKYTGELVNTNTLYFKVSEICKVVYPAIKSYKLIRKEKHQESEKGWYIKGMYFYIYYWQIELEDGTTIDYSNQKTKMDLKKGDFLYNHYLQELAFNKFLKETYGNNI